MVQFVEYNPFFHCFIHTIEMVYKSVNMTGVVYKKTYRVNGYLVAVVTSIV